MPISGEVSSESSTTLSSSTSEGKLLRDESEFNVGRVLSRVKKASSKNVGSEDHPNDCAGKDTARDSGRGFDDEDDVLTPRTGSAK